MKLFHSAVNAAAGGAPVSSSLRNRSFWLSSWFALLLKSATLVFVLATGDSAADGLALLSDCAANLVFKSSDGDPTADLAAELEDESGADLTLESAAGDALLDADLSSDSTADSAAAWSADTVAGGATVGNDAVSGPVAEPCAV